MFSMGYSTGLAEAVRFELTGVVKPRQFSRLLHSTALPRFLWVNAGILTQRLGRFLGVGQKEALQVA